ncbi:hypothetical protein D3C81_1471460 [compost metagenome]
MVAVAFDQTQINFVLCNLVHDMGCVLHVQLDLAFRVYLHEAADQQGRQVVANGQRGADRQRAEGRLAIEQVFDFLGLVEQGDSLWQQLMAQGVEAQALAGAIEQLAAGLALKLGDGSAGSRLRQRQQAGGPRDALMLGHGDEDLELTKCESHIYITDNTYLDNSVNRYCRCP